MSELVMPTVEEVFDRPYPPAPPIPPAWTADTIAREFTDQECAKLIAEALKEGPQWK